MSPASPAERRRALLGQRGGVVWLTGLSGAGKSTLARGLEAALLDAGRLVTILDGDVLREGLNADLGFSPAERAENIRRVTEVARLLADVGVLAVVAAISPYDADRLRARERIGADRFLLVHVATALEVCRRRDPKGLYARADRGELPGFTGVDAPYEVPQQPDLALDTAAVGLEAAVATLTREALRIAGFAGGG